MGIMSITGTMVGDKVFFQRMSHVSFHHLKWLREDSEIIVNFETFNDSEADCN